MNSLTMEGLYKIVLERAKRSEGENAAARMVIGPLSNHANLLDATTDVCRQLQHAREALRAYMVPAGATTDELWRMGKAALESAIPDGDTAAGFWEHRAIMWKGRFQLAEQEAAQLRAALNVTNDAC